ncbi:hypothetical protein MPTK1_5g05070 [Marchantia polymorpha subsp. ruderalis]
MPELMMPGEPGLLVPKPVIDVGTMGGGVGATTAAAALASDYTWSMIIATMACAVMVVVSAMKGVRRFSFAFTYTNLWYIFGRRGRLKVRLQSFTSTNGSNCFVTTSGEFTAELVDEEAEKPSDCSFPAAPSVAMPPGPSKAGCIVGTEMVFIYNNTTSIFSTGTLARASSSSATTKKKSYREALCCTSFSCCSSSLALALVPRDALSRRALAASDYPAEWQLGARRALAAAGESQPSWRRNSPVPEWAWSLLEPLELARIASSVPATAHHQRERTVPSGDYYYHHHPWDAALTLRLAGPEECRRGPTTTSRSREFVFPSGVVAGAAHTATLRNNVVKLWDNSSRLAVGALPARPSSPAAFVSSLDVDWRRQMGVTGSSSGELSLWDLARAQCVTSSRGPAGGTVRVTAAERSQHDGWVVTAGRSRDDCTSCCVSLWDSRAMSAAAGGTTSSAGAFSAVEDLMFRDYEVVARDESCRISMLDTRKLNSSSPVFEVSADELSSGSVRAGRRGEDEDELELDMWWDDAASAASATDESTEEDVYFDGDWVAVAGDQESVKSPSVLSRCFSALSSAISR